MIEGVVLTGGASRRMGAVKAHLMIGRETVAERTAGLLARHCTQVTILGREPIGQYHFQPDIEEFSGPLVALSAFSPTVEWVFVAACDMPNFDEKLIPFLGSLRMGYQAIVPEINGHAQPLCALYASEAWVYLNDAIAEGKRSLMGWLDALQCRFVGEEIMLESGIDPQTLVGANSPEEWAKLTNQTPEH